MLDVFNFSSQDPTSTVAVGPSRALIIRRPYIGQILCGLKLWEMRSSATKIRGRIGLIEAGSGLIVGEAQIVGVREIPKSETAWHETRHYHRIPKEDYALLQKW